MNLKNQINFTIILFFVFVSLLILFLIYPTFLRIKNISKEIKETKAKISFLDEETKNIENFRKFYKENEENFKKIDNTFINPEAPVEFISFLEETSQEVGISIKISPITPTGKSQDSWPSLSFQITLGSPPTNFLKFLERLESSPYLIEIQNLNINKLSEAELQLEEFKKFSPGSVKANILIKVYTK